ncbi:MAG: helix-hairpin-helix domain-containing protein [Candidatus Omnitrophota bacterium]
MFDLVKRELFIVTILSFLLILGFMLAGSRRSGPVIDITIKGFEPDLARAPGRMDGPVPYPAVRIDINKAGPEDLMRLSGVGKTLAERIIEYRSSEGRFMSTEEIKNVRGIGERLFEEMSDEIYVE